MLDFQALFDFSGRPGLYFLWATLLPLLSFLILLLAGGIKQALRPYGGALFDALGGNKPTKNGAYVAIAAIGGAFLLCVLGSLQFFPDQHKRHDLHHDLEKVEHAHHKEGDRAKRKALEAEGKALQKQIADIDARWSDRVNFAVINPKGPNDVNRGSLLQLGYRIDHLSVVMFLMVTFIATLIHIFSSGYMAEELEAEVADHQVHTDHGHLHRRGRFGRFFLFLSLFCFSMLNLILADNLFQVFISWELVGICSYLLIGFYFERTSASNAANKAFITNRVGDAGFVIGLLIVWTYLGTFNFEDIFRQVRAPVEDAHHDPLPGAAKVIRVDFVKQEKGERTWKIAENGSHALLFPRNQSTDFHIHAEDFNTDHEVDVPTNPKATDYSVIPYWMLVVAGIGIFVGCVGKSAQYPLHVWLPDAMEGPTPVSALIHAATMVAAGVYLVGRTFPLFTAEAQLVIAYTGAITLFVAATIAIVMTDIKKVLAYSTVSQLGYMMLALGIGGWVAGLFHLVTHAFFKALLFLCSGSVIYGCHHEQEMTKMGGLFPKMKITALTMLVGVLAIAGIPLFSGWYSKDAILAQAIGFVSVHPEHTLLFVLPLMTAGITTFYMFRMWLMTFTGKPRDHHVYEHAHESPSSMTVPLMALAFFSVVVAWGWPLFSTHFPFVDPHSSVLEHQLHHAQPVSVQADFGSLAEHGEHGPTKDIKQSERAFAHEWGHLIGNLALGIVGVAIFFAFAVYYWGWLDPAEAVEQFPAVYRFLQHKWYFDELYSAMLVRPSLAVAGWFRGFDLKGIDGFVHWLARAGVNVSRWDGIFDNNIIDGIANLIARVSYAVGGWFRTWQTGYIRSYILFLALAAVGLFAVLAYFVARATAGG